jgi:hypothetical protein
MFIKYDEYELLELFENEPVVIGDKEAGMFIYSKNDDLGFKLVLTISIYEKECGLSLNYKNFKSSIFDFKLKDIDRITCDNQKLKLLSNNGDKNIEVTFKPIFSLKSLVL